MLRKEATRDATADWARRLGWSMSRDSLKCADLDTAWATRFTLDNNIPQWNSAPLTEALKRTQP